MVDRPLVDVLMPVVMTEEFVLECFKGMLNIAQILAMQTLPVNKLNSAFATAIGAAR